MTVYWMDDSHAHIFRLRYEATALRSDLLSWRLAAAVRVRTTPTCGGPLGDGQEVDLDKGLDHTGRLGC
ncbi:hypothetical protein [Streptomyces sp. 2-1]|uniref:hypothetical protein n=1 Tax=Streptomyces sp. 2-1 TaxID=412710 RepID=UPI003AFB080E